MTQFYYINKKTQIDDVILFAYLQITNTKSQYPSSGDKYVAAGGKRQMVTKQMAPESKEQIFPYLLLVNMQKV